MPETSKNEEEVEKMKVDFRRMSNQLHEEGSQMNSVLKEMFECESLRKELIIVMLIDSDIISLFDELMEKKHELLNRHDEIKSGYSRFKTRFNPIWKMNKDLMDVLKSFKTEELDIEGFMTVLEEDERFKKRPNIPKIKKVWKKLNTKEQLQQCIADMNALHEESAQKFCDLWTPLAIN